MGWNLRIKLCFIAPGKQNVSRDSLQGFVNSYIMFSYSRSSPMSATIPDPFDILLMISPPYFLIHSPDLGSVRAQRIIFLGRFLV